MYNSISSRIPVVIVPFTLMKNMMPCFNRIEAAWVLKLFLSEESKFIFTY